MIHPTVTLGAAAAIFSLSLGGAYLGITEAKADDDKSRCPVTAEHALSISQIAGLLEGQGYIIQEIEKENGCLEAEVITRNGQEMELLLNPVNGEILASEIEDKDDDKDKDDA